MVPCGSLPIARNYLAKNEAPEEEAEGGGGGGGWNPSLKFLACCSISKRFYLYWKAFDLLNKMRYILWVVALLGACDVTNNSRHLDRNLGLCQELKIRVKPRKIVIFCALREK